MMRGRARGLRQVGGGGDVERGPRAHGGLGDSRRQRQRLRAASGRPWRRRWRGRGRAPGATRSARMQGLARARPGDRRARRRARADGGRSSAARRPAGASTTSAACARSTRRRRAPPERRPRADLATIPRLRIARLRAQGRLTEIRAGARVHDAGGAPVLAAVEGVALEAEPSRRDGPHGRLAGGAVSGRAVAARATRPADGGARVQGRPSTCTSSSAGEAPAELDDGHAALPAPHRRGALAVGGAVRRGAGAHRQRRSACTRSGAPTCSSSRSPTSPAGTATTAAARLPPERARAADRRMSARCAASPRRGRASRARRGGRRVCPRDRRLRDARTPGRDPSVRALPASGRGATLARWAAALPRPTLLGHPRALVP